MALNSVKDGNKKWVSSEWPRGAVARWINALQHLPCSVLLQPVIIFLFLLHLTTFFSRPRNSCLLARLIYSHLSSSQFPIELFLRCNSFQFIPAPFSIDRDRDAYDESKTFFSIYFILIISTCFSLANGNGSSSLIFLLSKCFIPSQFSLSSTF